MFRVALGISILFSAVFPLGKYLVGGFSAKDLQFLGPWGLVALMLVVKYLLVASLLYFVFRLVRLDQRFNLNGKGSTRVLVASCVVIAYAIVLALARQIEGGGPGYVAAQMSVLFWWPSWAVILWGLILMSMAKRDEVAPPNTSLER